MKPNHGHILREQAELRRIMLNFNPKASQDAKPKMLEEMLRQKSKYAALERIQQRRNQQRQGLEL